MKKRRETMGASVFRKALLFCLLLVCVICIPRNAQAANKLKLTAGCTYSLDTDSDAVWKSSKTSVLKVLDGGSVKAVKTGKAKLTCYVNDEKTLSYTVQVIKFKPVKMTKLKCYKKYRKYMTYKQFKKAYKVACKIVKPYAGFSKKDKLYAIAQGVRAVYDDNNGTYSMSSKHYKDPYGYLVKHTASCAGCTRATGLCLNILGISFEHVNENKYSHQWCRVKVGDEYWICDPFGLYVGEEPGVRKHPYL